MILYHSLEDPRLSYEQKNLDAKYLESSMLFITKDSVSLFTKQTDSLSYKLIWREGTLKFLTTNKKCNVKCEAHSDNDIDAKTLISVIEIAIPVLLKRHANHSP